MLKRLLPFLLLVLTTLPAQSELVIEITEGSAGAQPIAVVPFGWEGKQPLPVDIAQVVGADLGRTGRFAIASRDRLPATPTQGSDIRFKQWREAGQENLVVGRVKQRGPGAYTVQFQLFDVFKGEQLVGYSIPVPAANLRRLAHHIADLIYLRLTGEPGAFNSRIAYVAVTGEGKDRRWALTVADSDGFQPKAMVEQDQPLMSPAWSPDGKRLAYVSFEGRKPAIYVQTLATGKRVKVASFKGINGAPAWSPDGSRLAMTLSKDGSPDIYVKDLSSGQLTQLTRHYGIDTEPNWHPDGRSLVFTSDRGGKPQLYRIGLDGSPAVRVTFEGEYNARGRHSADGKSLAMVQGEGNRFRIVLMDIESGRMQDLSRGPMDESPSFAPNGSMVIHADGDGALSAASVDGRVRQRLTTADAKVREPAWSPLLK